MTHSVMCGEEGAEMSPVFFLPFKRWSNMLGLKSCVWQILILLKVTLVQI